MVRNHMSSPPQHAGNGVAPPAQVPKLTPQPRQRRRGLLLLGVLVVAGGGVISYQTITGLSARVPVLVMTHDVAPGRQLTADNVTTTTVGVDNLVPTIPARDLPSVIGKRAATDLVAGMLVQPRLLTDQVVPVVGQQLVPVAVKPSRLPARGLRPGDAILVLATPENQAVPASRANARPVIDAVVDQVKGPDTDGLMVVDLIVSNSRGAELASLAASGQVALVLNPRSR
ncbi:hypothetical protein F5972_12045 [Microbispora cellulosiformans]|uniref:SAF domain-containing protein n=1 Tax=Microbispora cellulosiformans TaxID=2614688 RepID=A0A5J5K3V8_9ACTN|nr:SAF domain-containing protein [Microbispora cellulosiformans]KAA9378958.1 hypothetical protein F5972_12045 [Microbispora cellulosiformans]